MKDDRPPENGEARTRDEKIKTLGQKFSLSGAFERNFDRDGKIVRTRGWACTMQAQA